jgi:hypothetical protein
MARPNITLTRTLTCPAVIVTDGTTYPSNPDPHELANYNLIMLDIIDESSGDELTDYSSIEGNADILLEIGSEYQIELADGLYKMSWYFAPTGVVSATYALNDCILVGSTLYKCTSAGALDNSNPLLAVTSTWTALSSYLDLYSDYIEEFYVVCICGYAEMYRDKLQTSLITNSSVCPKINNDEDFVACMKIIELINYGGLVNPSISDLTSATTRTRVIEAFSKLSLICQ